VFLFYWMRIITLSTWSVDISSDHPWPMVMN